MQITGERGSERGWIGQSPDLSGGLRLGDAAVGWTELEPAGRRGVHPVGDVTLTLLRDVVWFPRTGLVVTSDGRAVPSTVGAAPSLAVAVRGVPGGRADYMPPASLPVLDRASVWLGFGAMRNYGHFLFDAMTGLTVLAAQAAFPAVSGPLLGWQRDLLARGGFASREVGARAVRVRQILVPSTMNHYLHRSDGVLRDMAARLGRPTAPGRKIVWLSRRGFSGRILINEAAIEAALAAQGAVILRPERMSVADQVAAMADCRVLAGASGAGLANLCFLAPGARVVEVRPAPVFDPWIELGCANLGLGHAIVAADGPLPPAAVPFAARLRQLPRRLTGRYHFCCQADPAAVLAAITGAHQHPQAAACPV